MFEGIAALFAEGAGTAAAVGTGAALTAETVLPTMLVTASAGGAAAGLGAGELAALGLAGTGAAAASGAFDAGGNSGDPGYPGNGMPYDANGLPYDTAGSEFPNPISDQQITNLTQQAGTSLGLQDAGFTWKDGVGWARNALGLANAAAGLFGSIQNGRYRVSANKAAANDSRLSAEDAKRRADQLEQWGMGESKVQQPWDESGGRKLAGDQLQALLRDPSGVAANDPAYKLRMQAASRAMGIYGQDSGAMGVAAADASSTWYDQRLQQLSGLAGANAAPGAGGQLGLNSLTGSANIAGQGQASGAFGNQAANAAHNTQIGTTLNAAGQLVDAAGRLIGGTGSGGSNLSIGIPENSGGGGSGLGPDAEKPLYIGSSPTPGAPSTINGKPGYEASLGMSQYGGAVAGTRGPYLDPNGGQLPPTAMAGFGVPNLGGIQQNVPGQWTPPPNSIGDRTATGYDPMQQMQDLGHPGPVPNGPLPNAQGNMSQFGGAAVGIQPIRPGLGANEPGQDAPDPYASLFSSAGGDLLGDYLRPRGRPAMGG